MIDEVGIFSREKSVNIFLRNDGKRTRELDTLLLCDRADAAH